LVCSIAIMSSCTSIAMTSSNDFKFISTFWYPTSNFILLACK
jgi:hypothetical protein